MRSDSGKLGWSRHLNMKTPAFSLLTEIGDDRGNFDDRGDFDRISDWELPIPSQS